MAIIRWDPFRDIVTLRERMNRMFEDIVTQKGEDKDIVSSSWAPAVDIYETEGELVLQAEIPGIDEKDIEISIEDNTLTLKGERKFEKETREENYHRIERSKVREKPLLALKDDLPGIPEIVAGEGMGKLLDPHRVYIGEKPLYHLCGPQLLGNDHVEPLLSQGDECKGKEVRYILDPHTHIRFPEKDLQGRLHMRVHLIGIAGKRFPL